MEKPQYKDIVYTMAQHEQLLLKLEDLEKKAFSKSYISFQNYDYGYGGMTCTFYSDAETVEKFKDLISEANYHQSEFNRYKLMLKQQMQINDILSKDIQNLHKKITKLSEEKQLSEEKPKRFLGFLWKIKGNK